MVAEKGRAPNTLAAYRRDLTAYCDWLERHGSTPLDVDHQQLVAFVGERRADRRRDIIDRPSTGGDQDAAPVPVDRGGAARRSRCRSRGRSGAAGIPKPLTEAQVTSLIDAVVVTEPIHRRDLALIELLYATGARISEAVGLSIGEIDLECATRAAVRQGIQGADRSVRFDGSSRPSTTGSRRAGGPRWCPISGGREATPRPCS